MTEQVSFDDFFFNLPSDPEDAFVVYYKRCLDELVSLDDENSGYYYHRQFADKILAFDEVYALGLFAQWAQPPSDDRDFPDFFWPFKRAAEKAALKFQLERARRVSTSAQALVVFDASSRQAIHQLVDAIRAALNNANLTESKRASLFLKLNNFAQEVDQNLTRTESIFRFAAEISRVAKDAGETLRPITDRVDRLLDMVDRAQTWAESLPPWNKRKEIPAPPKRIEDKTQSRKSIDDDIPF